MRIIAAFILDIVFGDPEWFPHPVVLMGKWISFQYRYILRTEKQYQKVLGIAAALFNTTVVALGTNWLLELLPEGLSIIASIYILYTTLAAKTLHKEAKVVEKKLMSSTEAARTQLSRIVGRDTASLSKEEIICATVETVSENTSDGIIAPLIYAAFFGPAGAIAYKMINTMDSMVGYKNDKYKEAGYGAAKLDDLANLIPARATAFLMALTQTNLNIIRRTLKTIKQYHGAHLSPNAAWPESAAAGILGIQLGGGHDYFGEYVHKPVIGESLKQPEEKDIARICTIMWRVSLWFILLYSFIVIMIRSFI